MPKSAGRSRRHVADISLLEMYSASLIIDDYQQSAGFEISGWRISTKSSTIGNEGEMDDLTAIVQDTGLNERFWETRFTRNCVCPSFHAYTNNIAKPEKEDGDESDLQAGKTSNAQDALVEWAECHYRLPLPPNDGSNAYDKGVSIIKCVDAKLWEERQAREKEQVSSPS